MDSGGAYEIRTRDLFNAIGIRSETTEYHKDFRYPIKPKVLDVAYMHLVLIAT